MIELDIKKLLFDLRLTPTEFANLLKVTRATANKYIRRNLMPINSFRLLEKSLKKNLSQYIIDYYPFNSKKTNNYYEQKQVLQK